MEKPVQPRGVDPSRDADHLAKIEAVVQSCRDNGIARWETLELLDQALSEEEK